MRSPGNGILVAVLVAAGGGLRAASAFATPAAVPGFDHYQVILDRQPFGRPAEAAATNAAAGDLRQAQAEQALARQYRLCAVTRTQQGVAAGLIDSSVNPPKNLYLYVGESAEGVTLINADLEAETAEIRKDGATLTFTLTGVKAAPAGVAPPSMRTPASTLFTSAAAGSGPPIRLAPQPPQPPSVPAPLAVSTGSTSTAAYLERLKQRRAEIQAQNASHMAGITRTAEKLAAEAAEAAMRKRNLEMIRRGEGSLGIPLTPEEDAQLVREGVLPAAQ